MRTIAEWNPISALVQAVRVLWGDGPVAPADAAWPLQNPVATLIWTILITAVMAPLSLGRSAATPTSDVTKGLQWGSPLRVLVCRSAGRGHLGRLGDVRPAVLVTDRP